MNWRGNNYEQAIDENLCGFYVPGTHRSRLRLRRRLGEFRPADPVETDGDEPGVVPVPSPYCTGDCLEAVTLQADPLSIDCTVGLSWNSAGHPFGANAISRSEDAAAEFFPNMTLITGEGQGDSLTQVSQIEDLLVQGIDVLIISPTDAAALTPVVEQAKEQGVQVIASDRNVDTEVATCSRAK